MKILEKLTEAGLTIERKNKDIQIIAKDKDIPWPPDEQLLTELKESKAKILEYLKKEEVAMAMKRLQHGETDAIRIYSRTLDDELWIIRDGVPREALEVELPIYNLSEIKKLIDISEEDLKRIHLAKKEFKGSSVKTSLLSKMSLTSKK